MMETVRACIEQHADASPDRPFLIAPDIGKTLSFAELKVAVDDVGRQLDQLDIAPGAKVAFLLNNGYWTLRLFLGVMASSRIIVPLNAVAGTVYPATSPLDGTVMYNLTIPSADATTYTLRATPVGRQAGDGILEITHLGRKGWDKNNDGDTADTGESSWD